MLQPRRAFPHSAGSAYDDFGDVVELVDTLDLGSSASRRESSSLSVPTTPRAESILSAS